jgi:hypothetical protein
MKGTYLDYYSESTVQILLMVTISEDPTTYRESARRRFYEKSRTREARRRSTAPASESIEVFNGLPLRMQSL